MLNNFLKIILVFFMYNALPIYAMKRDYENKQQTLYNSEANSQLLDIINTLCEKQLPIEEDWKNIINCLERKADPNLKGKNETTILELASLGPLCGIETKKYLSYFLEQGADPNICNDENLTPLHTLLLGLTEKSYNLDFEMLEILLKHKANPNKEYNKAQGYMTPLHFVAKYGNKDAVEILIKYNANINKRIGPKNYKFSPLDQAIFFKNLETTQVLCRKYASLDYISNFGNVFHLALNTLNTSTAEQFCKILITNARFNLPPTKKELDAITLEFLLILKHQFKSLQIPKDLIFRILAMLSVIHNPAEFDGIFYQVLLRRYKNHHIYLLARVKHHIYSIEEILKQPNSLGETGFFLLDKNPQTQTILLQLKKGIESLFQSNNQKTLSDNSNNLALQIYNNYAELLEEQTQNKK